MSLPRPFLDTPAASQYLKKTHDLDQTAKTLRNRRWAGTGPRWHFWGRIPYTTPELLDEWVEQMLSEAAVNRRQVREGRMSGCAMPDATSTEASHTSPDVILISDETPED